MTRVGINKEREIPIDLGILIFCKSQLIRSVIGGFLFETSKIRAITAQIAIIMLRNLASCQPLDE